MITLESIKQSYLVRTQVIRFSLEVWLGVGRFLVSDHKKMMQVIVKNIDINKSLQLLEIEIIPSKTSNETSNDFLDNFNMLDLLINSSYLLQKVGE